MLEFASIKRALFAGAVLICACRSSPSVSAQTAAASKAVPKFEMVGFGLGHVQ